MMSKTVANPSRLAGRVARAAALGLLAVAAVLLPAREARAQWTQPDAQGNINNTNPGNVGVGTSAPQSSLHVSTSSTSAGSRGIINEQTSNDVNGSLLIVRKSRAGTSVLDGDAIGNFYASAFDGTSWTNGGRIRFVVDGPVAAGSVPTAMEFITGTNTSAPTRMRITSGGNVGVNIAAPTATFHVFGASGGPTGTAAPTAFNVTGGPGGNGQGAGGAGGELFLQGGAGGWNTTGSSSFYSGNGGGINLTGGTGGQHLFGVSHAGAGGPINISGGTGGAHNVSGYTGGVGGNIFLNGGAGGTGTNAGAPGNVILANQRGNVGVGTASPSHTLTVHTASGVRSGLSLRGDGNPYVYTDLNMSPATSTGIAAGKPVNFAWSVRKDAFYGGDASGPSMVMEIFRQGGGAFVPFIINPSGNVILAGATNAANGNVGVGTLAPAHKLDVSGNVNAGGLCIAGVCKTDWSQVSGGSQWTTSGSNIHFSGGYVGIGTTAPLAKLDLTFNGATEQGLRIHDTRPAGAEFGGHILFNGNSNGAGAPARFGQIGGLKENATAGNMLGFLGFYTNNGANANSVVERMRISSAGNVGIGTAAPASKLTVADGNIQIQTTSLVAGGPMGDIGFGPGGGAYSGVGPRAFMRGYFQGSSWYSGAALAFFTHPGGDITANNNYAERMRIDKDGNVGVGTTAPAYKLDVAGNVNASAGLCIAGDCKTAWSQIGATQWTTGAGNIHYNSGNVGIGTTNPSQKLGVQGMIGLYPQAWTLPSGRGMFMLHGGASGSIYAYNYTTGTPDPISVSAESLDFNTYVGGNAQQRMFISNTGNIGIGTGAPSKKLHVFGGNVMHQWSATANQEYGFYTSINNNHFTSNLYFDGQWRMLGNGRGATISTAPQSGAAFSIYADNSPRLPGSVSSLTNVMQVTMEGKVGIGTTAPSTALHVVGDVTVTGNIAAKFQDVAEWVPSTQELKAGTVVVLDGERANHVLASSQAYDTRVAGVVSAQPGVILGEAGTGKLMVATTGRVKVKVDATRAPIRIGDLLVTSDVEGVAMKSQPVALGGRQFHSPGTLIGKALEPLEKGVGEILVLLSLQ